MYIDMTIMNGISEHKKIVPKNSTETIIYKLYNNFGLNPLVISYYIYNNKKSLWTLSKAKSTGK